MKKILVIEDEEELRESIVEILTFEGFDIHEAPNGLIGVNKAKEEKPDLILCDIMMPEMNGFEVLAALKIETDFSQTPFIFLTALGDRTNTREGMNLGADDYLTKPFTKDELLDAISSKLEKYKGIINIFSSKIEEVENTLNNSINQLKGTNEELEEKIKSKDEEIMVEALKVIDTNNKLISLKKDIEDFLSNKNLNIDERKKFVNLKNRIGQNTILSNNWTLFQLKFNQKYPYFISKLSSKHNGLTEYDLLLASSVLSGLNNNQIADLLCVTPESARKSRYRLKKKLGLGKEQELNSYISSFNL